jgi:hypothetical protein
MNHRLRLLISAVLVMHMLSASRANAHHGPPHDEIDEFGDATARLAVPGRALRWSWPALVVSVGGVAVALALSRKVGVERVEASAVHNRR